MAFAFIRTQQLIVAGTSASASLNLTTPAVQGNLVLFHTKVLSSTTTILSLSDNVGNVYVTGSVIRNPTSAFQAQYQCYGVQVIAGAATMSITMSAGGPNWFVAMDEFSGGESTNAAVFDVAATNSGSTASASLAITASSAGKLIVAQFGGTGTPTLGSGWTNSLSTNQGMRVEYKLSGSATELATSVLSAFAWTAIARSYNLYTAPTPPTSSPLIMMWNFD